MFQDSLYKDKMLKLVDLDTLAYDQVIAACRLPKKIDADKKVKSQLESKDKEIEKAKKDNTLDEDDKKLSEKELKKRYENIAKRRVKLAIIIQKIATSVFNLP